MRLFYLDHNPRKAARAMVDSHVGKACVEYAMLLASVWRMDDAEVAEEQGLPEGFPHHPDLGWMLESVLNYAWVFSAWEECLLMFNEVTGLEHYAGRHRKALMKVPPSLQTKMDPVPYFPGWVREELLINDEVEASRLAYQFHAARTAVWTGRDMPEWWHDPGGWQEVH
jgi:hypothetical protein